MEKKIHFPTRVRGQISELCKKLANQESRIRYHRNPENLGSVVNWNQALELSSGVYFMWASDHDLFSQDYISRSVDVLKSDEDCTLVYSRAQEIDRDGNHLETLPPNIDTTGIGQLERFRKVLWGLGRCTMVHGVQRTRNIKALGGFPNSWAMDLALVPALSLLGTFHQLDAPLFLRRQNRPNGKARADFAAHHLDPSKATIREKYDRTARYTETREALLSLLDKIQLNPITKLQLRAMVYSCYWSRWSVGLGGIEHLVRRLPKAFRRPSFLRP